MLSYLKIAGKNYPLSFSLGAQKAIAAKYGGMKILDAFTDDDVTVENIDMLVWMTELFISQGCAYKNYFEKDMPIPDDSPVDKDGKWIPISAEAIEIGITNLEGLQDVVRAIAICIAASSNQEIETEPTEDAVKNIEAAQSK